jgi:hypothetical protein
MTKIAEKELVHAPLASADTFLRAFFAAHPAPEGAGARIVLHAGDAEKAVIFHLHPAHRPEDMTPRYAVRWQPEDDGPYPVFKGELTIGGDNDYSTFWLVLEGEYAPPGGVAGEVFDAVIGHRIARASARGLLREIRTEIESDFAARERAKPSSVVR